MTTTTAKPRMRISDVSSVVASRLLTWLTHVGAGASIAGRSCNAAVASADRSRGCGGRRGYRRLIVSDDPFPFWIFAGRALCGRLLGVALLEFEMGAHPGAEGQQQTFEVPRGHCRREGR